MHLPIKKTSISILISMMCILIGCSPTVKIETLRPSEINMSSLRRLALTDFDYYRGNIDSIEDYVVGIIANHVGLNYGDDIFARETASYVTNEIFQALRDTGYFDIVDMTSMAAAQRHSDEDMLNKAKMLGAAAILEGIIDRAGCELEDYLEEVEFYDSRLQKKIFRLAPWIRQNCELVISYKVVRVSDNVLIERKQFTEYSQKEVCRKDEEELYDPEQWIRDSIDTVIPQIVKRLAPYHTYESRRMKTEKMDEPETKRAMQMVKDGNLVQAREIFLRNWSATSNPAAGYNAAVLYEAEGELIKAANLLQEVMSVSTDRSVTLEYRFVLDAIEERKNAEQQIMLHN